MNSSASDYLHRKQRLSSTFVLPVLIAAAGLVSTPAWADILARYNFGPDGTSPSVLTPTFVDPELSATSITGGSGVVLDLGNPATQPSTTPYLRVDFTAVSSTPAASITNNAYFEFTLTADFGFELDLQSLNFDVMRGGGGTPRGFDIRSSVDSFAATLRQMDVPTARPEFTNVDIDLTGPSFQDLSSITFRFYSYSPAIGSSVDYDSIVVSGAAIPEPSAAMGILAGVALLSGYRRSRRG